MTTLNHMALFLKLLCLSRMKLKCLTLMLNLQDQRKHLVQKQSIQICMLQTFILMEWARMEMQSKN